MSNENYFNLISLIPEFTSYREPGVTAINWNNCYCSKIITKHQSRFFLKIGQSCWYVYLVGQSGYTTEICKWWVIRPGFHFSKSNICGGSSNTNLSFPSLHLLWSCYDILFWLQSRARNWRIDMRFKTQSFMFSFWRLKYSSISGGQIWNLEELDHQPSRQKKVVFFRENG